MSRKRASSIGSSVDEFIADQMTGPSFRLAFADARARRIKRALASAVKSARRGRRLSQATLAKRVKTTQAVISRIENPNASYLPSIEVLSRIALALGANFEIAFVASQRKAA